MLNVCCPTITAQPKTKEGNISMESTPSTVTHTFQLFCVMSSEENAISMCWKGMVLVINRQDLPSAESEHAGNEESAKRLLVCHWL